MGLPAQAELLSDFVAGQPLPIGERFLQACPQGFAELQSEIRVSEQFPEPIVDQSAHELLELVRREPREIHRKGAYGGERWKCN